MVPGAFLERDWVRMAPVGGADAASLSAVEGEEGEAAGFMMAWSVTLLKTMVDRTAAVQPSSSWSLSQVVRKGSRGVGREKVGPRRAPSIELIRSYPEVDRPSVWDRQEAKEWAIPRCQLLVEFSVVPFCCSFLLIIISLSWCRDSPQFRLHLHLEFTPNFPTQLCRTSRDNTTGYHCYSYEKHV